MRLRTRPPLLTYLLCQFSAMVEDIEIQLGQLKLNLTCWMGK